MPGEQCKIPWAKPREGQSATIGPADGDMHQDASSQHGRQHMEGCECTETCTGTRSQQTYPEKECLLQAVGHATSTMTRCAAEKATSWPCARRAGTLGPYRTTGHTNGEIPRYAATKFLMWSCRRARANSHPQQNIAGAWPEEGQHHWRRAARKREEITYSREGKQEVE